MGSQHVTFLPMSADALDKIYDSLNPRDVRRASKAKLIIERGTEQERTVDLSTFSAQVLDEVQTKLAQIYFPSSSSSRALRLPTVRGRGLMSRRLSMVKYFSSMLHGVSLSDHSWRIVYKLHASLSSRRQPSPQSSNSPA